LFQLFHPLGVYLLMVGVEVWTDKDRINVDPDRVEETLRGLGVYRNSHVNPYHNNDNTLFIRYVES